MNDLRTLLSAIRRPRLLMRAARLGQTEYRRDRDLRRLMGALSVPAPDVVVPRLLSEEARLEMDRQAGSAAYNFTRHIEILIALIAEVRLLPRDLQV